MLCGIASTDMLTNWPKVNIADFKHGWKPRKKTEVFFK